jgi:predicted transcriptional regulator
MISMEELIRELSQFGLSDKEAAVYVAALELGPSPVQDIAHKAKVNRATTYVIIEALGGRGLLSSFIKGKKRFYVAEAPDRLRTILRLQQKELVEKENELNAVLPALMALYNAEGAKPQVRYLEGLDGLQTVRENFLRAGGEFIQIVPFDLVGSVPEVIEKREQHLQQLAATNAPYRALLITKETDFAQVPALPNGEVRLVPAEKFPIHGEITVRGNSVYLYSYKSAILAVIIVSQELADAVRALFDLAWQGTAAYPSRKS